MMNNSLSCKIRDVIIREKLFQIEDNILVAVSGGVDSMVLAHILHTLGYNIRVAHCNFALRGDDSDRDELLVKQWAEEKGIIFYTRRISITGSIQLEARKKRYGWFEKLCGENNLEKIVTAHHLNDSLETTLFNLVRGTGVKGLIGISKKKTANSKIVRPLASVTKNKLIDFAKNNNIQWREDASNHKNKYRRNLIRNKIVPLLGTLNPSLLSTYQSTQRKLRYTQDLIRQQKEGIEKKFVSTRNKTQIIVDLVWLKEKFQVLLLQEILEDHHIKISFRLAETVFDLRKQSGKQVLYEDHVFYLDRGILYVRKKENHHLQEEVIVENLGEYQTVEDQITIREIPNSEKLMVTVKNIHYLDRDKLKFPLLIRAWKKGENFKPLGMQGRKKISKYLIDEKVPLFEKKHIKVILSNQKIVAVMSMRIDDYFRVSEKTQTVLVVEIIKR